MASFLQPLADGTRDYDRLIEAAGDARFVLLGEASHGTQEFYFERAILTRRFVREKGFNAVVAEADWPDAWRVNRFVQGAGRDRTAEEALRGFRRFPAWMWRNEVVLDFVGWLREHNRTGAHPAGFYGMDLYSMYGSIEAVLAYLGRVDPEAARRARQRYACFEHFEEDSQQYGYAASMGLGKPCEDEVVRQLVELQGRAAEYASKDGDDFFAAEQNARLVKNAEEYYRTMFQGRVSSWNLRDRHMASTIEALAKHLERTAGAAKLVVWAHNSHLGDARATQMGRAGEWNVGQLMRERFPGETFLVGFSTYAGTVTAATDWDGIAETKRVRPGLPGSYEALFHSYGEPRFLAWLHDGMPPPELRGERLERAIGVIYHPETERQSHYFDAHLAAQFDAMIHIDETRALRPLELSSEVSEEAPETYPTGQ